MGEEVAALTTARVVVMLRPAEKSFRPRGSGAFSIRTLSTGDLALSTWQADRLTKLPPYLFVEIDRKKRLAKQQGRDVIDFGVGDPDRPTPDFIVKAMNEAITDASTHRYALGIGAAEFREAAASYMSHRFGVTPDPATEVLALIGSKEGIGHLPTAVLNPGQVGLIPEPGYPVYDAGTIFAGGECHTMPLLEQNDWLPVLDDIPPEIRSRARVMFLCYPNNPTAVCAPLSFYQRVVEFAKEHNILIANDLAYAEIYFGDPPPSILQVEGAKEVAIEFHSLSKSFNMTGWRVAFAVGNSTALASLAKVKSNVDSGIFTAIQYAGAAALQGIGRSEVKEQVEVYRQRRNALLAGLSDAGWPAASSQATFFVWVKCPAGHDSMSVASRILDEADVVVIPGAGFGHAVRGFLAAVPPRSRGRILLWGVFTWGYTSLAVARWFTPGFMKPLLRS